MPDPGTEPQTDPRHVCKPVLCAVGGDSWTCSECCVTYFMATFSMAQTYRGMDDA